MFFVALGENVILSGIDHRQLRAGQHNRLGEVVVSLTAIRIACKALEIYGPAGRAILLRSSMRLHKRYDKK